jgi:hypothetical protein
MKTVLGTTATGELAIDVDRVLVSRLLLQANSGAGKILEALLAAPDGLAIADLAAATASGYAPGSGSLSDELLAAAGVA